MELKEVYEKIGGDYDDVVRRLMGEKLVRKFLLKFLDDKSYADLERTLGEEDYKEAFRAAHTLKGVCQNLGFENLYVPAAALTEALRGRTFGGVSDLYPPVEAEYNKTVAALKQFEAAQ